MSTVYKTKTQRQMVFDAVRLLMDITAQKGTVFSKETLKLICDRYCYVVDPPDGPGEDNY